MQYTDINKDIEKVFIGYDGYLDNHQRAVNRRARRLFLHTDKSIAEVENAYMLLCRKHWIDSRQTPQQTFLYWVGIADTPKIFFQHTPHYYSHYTEVYLPKIVWYGTINELAKTIGNLCHDAKKWKKTAGIFCIKGEELTAGRLAQAYFIEQFPK